jgi:hypothetical protein
LIAFDNNYPAANYILPSHRKGYFVTEIRYDMEWQIKKKNM